MMQPDSASMKTPLGRARGHGSARSGTQHFWHQRLTSVANIPLTIAFIVIVISLLGRNHAAAVQILGSPLVAVLMILFILANVVHMKIGIQVVIEDYVYDKNQKFTLLILNTFFAWAIGLACVFAVLKISFGV